jgi:uncharacterized membrane protein YebE (DUF533 family)
MFNAEKLLGGMLLGGSRRRRGIGGLLSGGGVALGVMGVAMAAVEHYVNKSRTGSQGAPPPGVPGRSSPPPLPGASSVPAPAPPPAPGSTGRETAEDDSQAVLLIRAMIAAANADGVIDQEERNRVLNRLQAVQLTSEEHAFIVNELLAPKDIDGIVGQVKSAEMAREVYAASLAAIEVDTQAEKTHMDTLAARLSLDDAAVDEIHAKLGIERR